MKRAERDTMDNDYPVVVMASDLNKILRSYIDSGRTKANAAECDPAWENLHARLKAVHACEGCNEVASRRRVRWHAPRLIYGRSNPSKAAAMKHRKKISATLRRALRRG